MLYIALNKLVFKQTLFYLCTSLPSTHEVLRYVAMHFSDMFSRQVALASRIYELAMVPVKNFYASSAALHWRDIDCMY